jgi:hypothetical protein
MPRRFSKNLQASAYTPLKDRGLLLGTIIRGTQITTLKSLDASVRREYVQNTLSTIPRQGIQITPRSKPTLNRRP